MKVTMFISDAASAKEPLLQVLSVVSKVVVHMPGKDDSDLI